MSDRTRSSVEIGGVIAIILFILGLAFNSGIEYGKISTLGTGLEETNKNVHELQISAAKDRADVGASNLIVNDKLSHIETMVEDMRASQELKRTGAGR